MNFKFNDTPCDHDIYVFPVPPQPPRHRRALAWLGKYWGGIFNYITSAASIVGLILAYWPK